jgi:hypothetical protein
MEHLEPRMLQYLLERYVELISRGRWFDSKSARPMKSLLPVAAGSPRARLMWVARRAKPCRQPQRHGWTRPRLRERPPVRTAKRMAPSCDVRRLESGHATPRKPQWRRERMLY